MMKSTPAWASICSSNMSAASRSESASSGFHFHVVLRVAGDEQIVSSDVSGDTRRRLVYLDGPVGVSDGSELLAAAVEGHHLQDLGTGVPHLAVQLGDGLRVRDGKLRSEGAGHHVPTLLQLYYVAPVPQYDVFSKPFQYPALHRRSSVVCD